MAIYLIAILALVGCGLADDSYTQPSGGYSPPTGTYSQPTGGYSQPTGGYQTPSTGYGPADPPSYAPEYDSPQSYGNTEEDKFDLSKIGEILPLFLAVFAAIILAQFLSPLIGLLFQPIILLIASLFGIAGGKVGLLGGIKIGLLNAILGQFNLQICTTAVPPVAARSADGREDSASGFSLNPDILDNVAQILQNALENYSA